MASSVPMGLEHQAHQQQSSAAAGEGCAVPGAPEDHCQKEKCGVKVQRITRFAFLLEFPDTNSADSFGAAQVWGSWDLEATPGWKVGNPMHGKAVGVMTAAKRLKEESEIKTQGPEPRWVRQAPRIPEGADALQMPSHYPVACGSPRDSPVASLTRHGPQAEKQALADNPPADHQEKLTSDEIARNETPEGNTHRDKEGGTEHTQKQQESTLQETCDAHQRAQRRQRILADPKVAAALTKVERAVIENPQKRPRNEELWVHVTEVANDDWFEDHVVELAVSVSEQVEMVTDEPGWMAPKQGMFRWMPGDQPHQMMRVEKMYTAKRERLGPRMGPFQGELYVHWWETIALAWQEWEKQNLWGEKVTILSLDREDQHRVRLSQGWGKWEGSLMSRPIHSMFTKVEVTGLLQKDWQQVHQMIGETGGEGICVGRAPLIVTLVVPRAWACRDCRGQYVTLAAVCARCRAIHRCTCDKVTFLADIACRNCGRKRQVCPCLKEGGTERWRGCCLSCRCVINPAWIPPATDY